MSFRGSGGRTAPTKVIAARDPPILYPTRPYRLVAVVTAGGVAVERRTRTSRRDIVGVVQQSRGVPARSMATVANRDGSRARVARLGRRLPVVVGGPWFARGRLPVSAASTAVGARCSVPTGAEGPDSGSQHRCRRRGRRLGRGVGGRRTGRARARATFGVRAPGVVRGCTRRSPMPWRPTSTSSFSVTPSPWHRISGAWNVSWCWRSTAAPSPWSCSPREISSTIRNRPAGSSRRSPSASRCLVSSGRTDERARRAAPRRSARDERSSSSVPAALASRHSSTPCSANSARRPRRFAAITVAGTPRWPPSCCACLTTAAG